NPAGGRSVRTVVLRGLQNLEIDCRRGIDRACRCFFMCFNALLNRGVFVYSAPSIGYSSGMTPDLIQPLTRCGAILIGVVVLVIIITIATVNRGATQMADEAKQHGSRRH